MTSNSKDATCGICQKEATTGSPLTPGGCGHSFHQRCVDEAIRGGRSAFCMKCTGLSATCAAPERDEDDDLLLPASSSPRARIEVTMTGRFGVISSEPYQLDAVVAVTAHPPGGDAPRAGADIVFVIDTSGSMGAENKLEVVTATLRAAAEMLSERDRVCFVSFSDEARKLTPLLRVDKRNQARLLRVAGSLRAAGNTNMLDGARVAREVLAARPPDKRNAASAVLLLTDGQDNHPRARLPDEIAAALDERDGVHIFGLGNDYSENFLRRIAELKRGTLAHVAGAGGIPEAFGNVMGAVVTTCARNLRVEIRAIAAFTRLDTSREAGLQIDRSAPDEHVVSIPELSVEQRKSVLLSVHMPAAAAANEADGLSRPVVTATLAYDAVPPLPQRCVALAQLWVARRPPADVPLQAPSEVVLYEVDRCATARALSEASAAASPEVAEGILRGALASVGARKGSAALAADLSRALDAAVAGRARAVAEQARAYAAQVASDAAGGAFRTEAQAETGARMVIKSIGHYELPEVHVYRAGIARAIRAAAQSPASYAALKSRVASADIHDVIIGLSDRVPPPPRPAWDTPEMSLSAKAQAATADHERMRQELRDMRRVLEEVELPANLVPLSLTRALSPPGPDQEPAGGSPEDRAGAVGREPGAGDVDRCPPADRALRGHCPGARPRRLRSQGADVRERRERSDCREDPSRGRPRRRRSGVIATLSLDKRNMTETISLISPKIIFFISAISRAHVRSGDLPGSVELSGRYRQHRIRRADDGREPDRVARDPAARQVLQHVRRTRLGEEAAQVLGCRPHLFRLAAAAAARQRGERQLVPAVAREDDRPQRETWLERVDLLQVAEHRVAVVGQVVVEVPVVQRELERLHLPARAGPVSPGHVEPPEAPEIDLLRLGDGISQVEAHVGEVLPQLVVRPLEGERWRSVALRHPTRALL